MTMVWRHHCASTRKISECFQHDSRSAGTAVHIKKIDKGNAKNRTADNPLFRWGTLLVTLLSFLHFPSPLLCCNFLVTLPSTSLHCLSLLALTLFTQMSINSVDCNGDMDSIYSTGDTAASTAWGSSNIPSLWRLLRLCHVNCLAWDTCDNIRVIDSWIRHSLMLCMTRYYLLSNYP